MREIKYKAWDLKRKKMGWVETLVCDYKNRLEYNNWICYTTDDMKIEERPCGNYREKKNVVLLQYAGLKDRNGKDIYEGDILKKPYYGYSREPKNNNYGIVKQEKGTCNLEFVWNFEARYEGEKYWDENILSLKRACEYEVVGNIFENPELLLKEKDK